MVLLEHYCNKERIDESQRKVIILSTNRHIQSDEGDGPVVWELFRSVRRFLHLGRSWSSSTDALLKIRPAELEMVSIPSMSSLLQICSMGCIQDRRPIDAFIPQ